MSIGKLLVRFQGPANFRSMSAIGVGSRHLVSTLRLVSTYRLSSGVMFAMKPCTSLRNLFLTRQMILGANASSMPALERDYPYFLPTMFPITMSKMRLCYRGPILWRPCDGKSSNIRSHRPVTEESYCEAWAGMQTSVLTVALVALQRRSCLWCAGSMPSEAEELLLAY